MASRPIQILIVAAHPADTFDQAGGTVAHHVAQGDKVTCLVATTGVRSHHWRLSEEKRSEGADFDVEQRVEAAVAENLEALRERWVGELLPRARDPYPEVVSAVGGECNGLLTYDAVPKVNATAVAEGNAALLAAHREVWGDA